MKGDYPLQKLDTNLYVKGLSGPLVFKALQGILAAFVLFLILYIGAGTFVATVTCIPLVFGYLYRLNQIQQTLGPKGWNKKQTASKLPRFIRVKKRILYQTTNKS